MYDRLWLTLPREQHEREWVCLFRCIASEPQSNIYAVAGIQHAIAQEQANKGITGAGCAARVEETDATWNP